METTATPSKIVNLPKPLQAEKALDELDPQDQIFYNSIKPQLDELIKDPSDKIINKILAYSEKK
jgi:hypothetical protein